MPHGRACLFEFLFPLYKLFLKRLKLGMELFLVFYEQHLFVLHKLRTVSVGIKLFPFGFRFESLDFCFKGTCFNGVGAVGGLRFLVVYF